MTRPPIDLHHTCLTWLPCPYHFQHYKLRRNHQPDSAAALIGITAHTIAARYGEYLKAANIRRAQRNIGFMARNPNEFDKILVDEINKVDVALRPDIIEVAENFCVRFDLHKGSEYVFERRLAVDREYKPTSPVCETCSGCGFWYDIVPDGEGSFYQDGGPCEDCHGTGLPPIDIIAGTADCTEITDGGQHARLTDYKMGWPDISYDTAIDHPQLMLYAALWLWHNPDCRDVTVRLWGPRYNRSSEHNWTRETLLPLVTERLEAAWARLDELWKKYGEKDWPTEASTACEYCELACPHEYWKEMYA